MRRRLLLLGGIALTIWAVVAGLWLVRIASDLQAGRTAASSAREHIGPEEVADRVPLADLRTASRRFGAARQRSQSWVLTPLRVAPVIGRQLHSVRALSTAAEEIAAAGAEAVDRAGDVLDRPAEAGSGRVGQIRVLGELVDVVVERLAAIDDLGPVRGLLSPLADARNELASDLADARSSLTSAQIGARAALSLVTGPRRYLVLAGNNAEMRAGSGMWLQGGVLVTNDGKLTLESMQSLDRSQPPAGSVTPTGDLAARWGFLSPGDEWRNLMASPRFEDSAKLAAQMWKAAGRGDVDGVLVLDAVGLQAIVEATGPVRVDDRRIDADGVLDEVLHDQYLDVDLHEDGSNTERRESLARLTEAAVDAIDAGDYPVSTLMRTLGNAIAGRHLLAWSTDTVEDAGWEAAGMHGSLEPESLLVSILNRGANKLDWFLRTGATIDARRARGGWDVEVRITLENQAPEGEPEYIVGPTPGLDLSPGEYRGILAVNVPGAASGARFDGVEHLAVAGRDGPTSVVGFQLELPPGERQSWTLRFHLPATVRQVRIEPSARVPAMRWQHGTDSWEDSASRVANL